MIYFSTALYYEALPLIEKYNMKKMTEVSQFQIFSSDDARLVISGVGGTSSAIAVTFLLTMSNVTERDFFVNMGVCGAVCTTCKNGDVVLCNKIINEPMGKIFFPDMLLGHPFKEEALMTCAKPVSGKERVCGRAGIVDMEGAFAYEAAAKFLPPHRIFTVKVVSDMCEPDTVTPDKVKELMYEAAGEFLPWLRQVGEFFTEECRDVLDLGEEELVDAICRNLKLSRSMTLEFKRLAGLYKVRCGGFEKLLAPYMDFEAGSKAEGKKYFSEIKNILMDYDI